MQSWAGERQRVLIAGIGNVFFGDDGFGVEVASRMSRSALPEGVRVMDVGIRSIHLTYELMNGYDIAILVDAAPRGEAPGTITVLEPDVADAADALRRVSTTAAASVMDPHGMGPVDVLTVLEVVQAEVGRVLLVACEPASWGEGIGLSPEVDAAVAGAILEIERLLAGLAGADA